jgi:hypothetical protein
LFWPGKVFYTKISHARKPESGIFLGHRDAPVAHMLGLVLTLRMVPLMYHRQGGHGISPEFPLWKLVVTSLEWW